MERIYYDSKTGNVARFIEKVKAETGWEMIQLDNSTPVYERGHLVTFTTRFGEIPEMTKLFLEQAGNLINSVTSSGNRNWGQNFGVAGDQIAKTYGVPLLLKFELSGTNEDVKQFINSITKYNYDNKRNRQELDPAQ